MGVLVIVIVVVIVTWESKANSSSSLTELQTGTELGNTVLFRKMVAETGQRATAVVEKIICIYIFSHLS